MAQYSFGGLNTHLGFGILGLVTVGTTILAYRSIRAGQVLKHREWMMRSYAAIFAGVMLRVELPFLTIMFGGPTVGFPKAYAIIAWACWVPNLLVAEWLIRRSRHPTTQAEVLGLARA
jgi:hypothetical protein